MAPTAVALCGKSPEHIEGLSKLLLPQGYDIIHVCRDLTAALTELPALLSSDSADPAPSSGYGSNASNADKTPGSAIRGVIIGGGYADTRPQSPDDVTQIKAAVDKVKPLPFFRADTTKPRPADAKPGPPAVEELEKRILESFEAAKKDASGSGGWEAGLYLF